MLIFLLPLLTWNTVNTKYHITKTPEKILMKIELDKEKRKARNDTKWSKAPQWPCLNLTFFYCRSIWAKEINFTRDQNTQITQKNKITMNFLGIF